MAIQSAIKKEPPIGSVILDKSGSAWQRNGYGNWDIAGGDGSWSYTWAQLQRDLVIQENDVPTQTWLPVIESMGKTPRILFIPGEELIDEQEE